MVFRSKSGFRKLNKLRERVLRSIGTYRGEGRRGGMATDKHRKAQKYLELDGVPNFWTAIPSIGSTGASTSLGDRR